jgi:hypothetical protein
MRTNKLMFAISASIAALLTGTGAQAADVLIISGEYYSSDLRNQLIAAGNSVTEQSSYTAASLAGFDAVVHYGNSFTDTAALSTYVEGGGTLVLTPWAGLNFSVPASLQVFANGGSADFASSFPGATVLDPSSQLLTGVSFPAAGATTVGRIGGIGFVADAAAVAAYGDGTALLGTRTFGTGNVVGVNLQVITSDTPYAVVNQPWASAMMNNAVNFGVAAAVPEPATWAMMIGGFGMVGGAMRSSRRQAKVAYAAA